MVASKWPVTRVGRAGTHPSHGVHRRWRENVAVSNDHSPTHPPTPSVWKNNEMRDQSYFWLQKWEARCYTEQMQRTKRRTNASRGCGRGSSSCCCPCCHCCSCCGCWMYRGSQSNQKQHWPRQTTRTLTLEPHTACRKGCWGLEYKINKKLIKN